MALRLILKINLIGIRTYQLYSSLFFPWCTTLYTIYYCLVNKTKAILTRQGMFFYILYHLWCCIYSFFLSFFFTRWVKKTIASKNSIVKSRTKIGCSDHYIKNFIFIYKKNINPYSYFRMTASINYFKLKKNCERKIFHPLNYKERTIRGTHIYKLSSILKTHRCIWWDSLILSKSNTVGNSLHLGGFSFLRESEDTSGGQLLHQILFFLLKIIIWWKISNRSIFVWNRWEFGNWNTNIRF